MWKVDLWLIPWLSLLYLLSFLDRTNIGNARLAGMEDDLGMGPGDYNVALTVFFVSYAFFEPITNGLLKRLTPRIFFTGIIIAWGTVMTLMGVCTNYSGLLAARFFLGVAEAGLYPGVNYYLGCWYKSSEIGARAAIFFSAAALAGSFGGLLAAAIAQMDGTAGRPGWAWIFILEGLATVLIGLFCWWMVFDWPDTASFLTPEERVRVQRRLIMDRQGRTAEDFDKRHIWAALKDWKTYGYMIIYMGCLMPLYAFSLFLPTILRGMGHVGTKAQLLSVPPYACAAAATVFVGFLGDRTKCRGYCNIGTVLVGIVGFAMLLGSADPHVQYGAVFLGAMGKFILIQFKVFICPLKGYCYKVQRMRSFANSDKGIYPTVSNTVSWVNNNIEGSLKRAIVLGMVVGWGNMNGVVSSNIYRETQKPRYFTGHGMVLAYQIVFLLGGSVFMHFALRLENRRRARGSLDAKYAAMTDEQRWISGDVRPDFRYTL